MPLVQQSDSTRLGSSRVRTTTYIRFQISNGGRRESEISVSASTQAPSRRSTRNHAQQAVVLFYVVAAFFASNVLRVCINAGEVAFADSIQERIRAGCKVGEMERSITGHVAP